MRIKYKLDSEYVNSHELNALNSVMAISFVYTESGPLKPILVNKQYTRKADRYNNFIRTIGHVTTTFLRMRAYSRRKRKREELGGRNRGVHDAYRERSKWGVWVNGE